MKNYICLRCGYTTDRVFNFRKHLNRKKICTPIMDDVTNLEQKIYYDLVDSNEKNRVATKCKKNVTIKCNHKCNHKVAGEIVTLSKTLATKSPSCNHKNKYYKCRHCPKKYKNRQHRWRHESNCKFYNKANLNKDNLYEKIEELICCMTELTEDNQKIHHTINNYKMENCKINSDNTQNIIINNFWSENNEYILKNKKLMKKLLTNPHKSIPNVIKYKHFHPLHPENHNIRFRNKNHKLGEIYKDNKWIYKNKKEILDDLLDSGYITIDEYKSNNKGELSDKLKKIITKVGEIYEAKNDELIEDIHLLVLNETKDLDI